MFRKIALALVATAALSAAALAPSAASAGGFIWPTFHPHHHWGHGGFGIGFVGGGYDGGGCYQERVIETYTGPRVRVVNVCAY